MEVPLDINVSLSESINGTTSAVTTLFPLGAGIIETQRGNYTPTENNTSSSNLPIATTAVKTTTTISKPNAGTSSNSILILVIIAIILIFIFLKFVK
jgi:hypothetical protein